MIDQVKEAEPSTDSEEEQDVNEQSSSSESETEETLLSVLQDAMEKPSEEAGSQPEEEVKVKKRFSKLMLSPQMNNLKIQRMKTVTRMFHSTSTQGFKN